MVHLLGYDVYPNMVDSLENVDFLMMLGPGTRNVMLARFAAKEGAPHPIHAMALPDRGFRTSRRQLSVHRVLVVS